eukprot:TRINITY_DN105364_c0_g1_i1.p1 TRINITY_DN105364_c0_g1~~TRINITY_DN105364_c0_g1_i1.p1  ORF type:complete len:412 (+),score=50.36 TRINITY_DN105364_c0_g1_i1:1868-3103(+)
MDVLTHGTLEEKAAISFSIVDIDSDSKITFNDFQTAVLSILEMWYTMTGSQVRLSERTLQYLFNKIDLNNDGEVSIDEYIHVLNQKSDMFNWFEILNNGYSSGVDRLSQRQPEMSSGEKPKEASLKEIAGAQEQLAEVLEMIQSLQPDELLFLSGKNGKEKPSPGTAAESPVREKRLERQPTFGITESPIVSVTRGQEILTPVMGMGQRGSSTKSASPNKSRSDPSKKGAFSDMLFILEKDRKTKVVPKPMKKDMLVAINNVPRNALQEYEDVINEMDEFDETIVKDDSNPSRSNSSKKGSSINLPHRSSPATTAKLHPKHEIVKGDESPCIVTPESSSEDEKEVAEVANDNNNHSTISLTGIGNSFLSTTLTESKKIELVEKLRKVRAALSTLITPEEYNLCQVAVIIEK